MKKFCSLIIVLAAFHFAAFAQFSQGSIYIDGSFNYNKDDLKFINTNYSTQSTDFLLSPNVGYFITSNLVVGVGLDYQSLNNNSSITTINVSTDIVGTSTITSTKTIVTATNVKWSVLAPAIFAKYILPVSDKLSFSLKARYSNGLLSDKSLIAQDTIFTDPKGAVTVRPNHINSEKPGIQSSKLNFSLGLQYLVTKNIGLEVNFAGFNINSVPKIQIYDNVTYSPEIVWGTQKTTSFNMNPSSWSFGVFISLGGKSSSGSK